MSMFSGGWCLILGILLGWLANGWLMRGRFKAASEASHQQRLFWAHQQGVALSVKDEGMRLLKADNAVYTARIAELEGVAAQTRANKVKLDKAAALAAGFTVRGMDDLQAVQGIDLKMAQMLNTAGVFYFSELARMPLVAIQALWDAAGPHQGLAHPDTWPEQAALAADNRWPELRALQDALNAGKRA
jgi:predicted flap endonuclease-1-like 5' DNA nuclease